MGWMVGDKDRHVSHFKANSTMAESIELREVVPLTDLDAMSYPKSGPSFMDTDGILGMHSTCMFAALILSQPLSSRGS